MSLQVWLPLNGNLNNQGVGIATVSGTATYTTNRSKVVPNSLNTPNQITINVPSIVDKKICTFAFWAYVESASVTSNWTLVARMNDKGTNSGSNMRFEVCPKTYGNGIYCFSNHNNANYGLTNGVIASPTGGYYDQWVHFCFTSDGKTFTRYMNGKKIGTCDYNGQAVFSGDFVLANNHLCLKQDVRIYDHCLSQKEVHELSKGLCLHYKLSRGGENLIKGTPVYNSPNSGSVSISFDDNLKNNFTSYAGKKLTLSYDYEINNIKTEGTYGTRIGCEFNYYSSSTNQTNKTLNYIGLWWKPGIGYSGSGHKTVTITMPSTIYALNGLGAFCVQCTSDNIKITNIKLEEGDHATSWLPYKHDLLYERLGYKRDDPNLYSKSLYSGETRNGSDSTRSSTITKTLNSDGSYKYKLSYTGNGSDAWNCIIFPSFQFTNGTTYHYVCKIRCNSANVGFHLRAARCSNDYATSSVNVTTVKGYSGWITYHVQAVCNTTLSGTASTVGSPQLEFYTDDMKTSGTTYSFDIDIKDCQIYSDNDYQQVFDIESDCSGYGNDGIINGNIVYSKDTPRYEGSSYFGYTQNVQGNFALNSFPITISFWAKVSQFDTSGWVVLAGQNSGYYLDADSSSGANWHSKATVQSYYRDGTLVVSANKATKFISRDGEWHHYVYICTLTDWTKMTVNGGSLWGSSWRANVNISDFRIYATALSADDIKALYNNPISIDNNKNLHCLELTENTNVSFGKSGIVKMKFTDSGNPLTISDFIEY